MRLKVLAVALSLFSVACSAPRAWVYAPEPRQNRGPVVDAALAVPPFLDRRPNDNTNAWLMYMIPVVPWGWQGLSTPEAVSIHISSGIWQVRPADDIARAFAQEIDAARIFRESFQSERASAGDYVLTGEVRRMRYDAKIFSYGLSVYGPTLWLIGFPSSHTSNELEVALTLRRADGTEPLWSYTIQGSDSNTGWIYAQGSDFMFDTILKDGMPAALASLEAACRSLATKAEPES